MGERGSEGARGHRAENLRTCNFNFTRLLMGQFAKDILFRARCGNLPREAVTVILFALNTAGNLFNGIIFTQMFILLQYIYVYRSFSDGAGVVRRTSLIDNCRPIHFARGESVNARNEHVSNTTWDASSRIQLEKRSQP